MISRLKLKRVWIDVTSKRVTGYVADSIWPAARVSKGTASVKSPPKQKVKKKFLTTTIIQDYAFSFRRLFSVFKTSLSFVLLKVKCSHDSNILFSDAVTEPNVEDLIPIKACNNKKCHQLCRKQKFRGGSCLGANCYCNKFLSMQGGKVIFFFEGGYYLLKWNCRNCKLCRRLFWNSWRIYIF